MDTQSFPYTEWGALQEKNPEPRRPKSFIMGNRQADPVLWRETLISVSQSFHYTYIFGKTFWDEGQSGPSVHRMFRNARDPR